MTKKQQQFMESHYGLVKSFLSKYLSERCGIDSNLVDEIRSELDRIFCRATIYYNPSKGKFSTYAYSCFDKGLRRWWLGKCYSDQQRQKRVDTSIWGDRDKKVTKC